MAKPKLGRGFDALIPRELDSSLLEEDKNRVQKILITDIKPNPEQPRRDFDESAMAELTTSVKRHGILQPIIVVRLGNGYRIVAGERRWKAAETAKLEHVPAIVRSLEELEQIELALIENIQRVNLSPLEQALSVYRLQHQFNLSLEQIAQKLGKAQSTVSNLSRLLKLPEASREALRTGKISEGHARAILSLDGSKQKQEELLRSILNNGWSVRQSEQYVASAKEGPTHNASHPVAGIEPKSAEKLTKYIGTNVKIRRLGRGGQIVIPFSSDSQLVAIIKKIIAKGE